MIKIALAALALAMSSAAWADSGVRLVPCGYQQLTGLSTAKSLTVPTTCSGAPALARVTVEAQAVRYRDDGTAPTASVGMPLAVGTTVDYAGTLTAIQFIEQTSGGIVNVSYYR